MNMSSSGGMLSSTIKKVQAKSKQGKKSGGNMGRAAKRGMPSSGHMSKKMRSYTQSRSGGFFR